MMMSDIEEIKKTPKRDKADEKRVEFHLHTAMSQMDGIPNISSYVEQARNGDILRLRSRITMLYKPFQMRIMAENTA